MHDPSCPSEAHHAADRAAYLAFSLTWARTAAARAGADEVGERIQDFFRAMCRRVTPTVALEVGAHQATFSKWAAKELPDAQVLAFEANPHVYQKHARDLGRTRVDYRHAAVGPNRGEVVLNVPTVVRGKARRLTNRMGSLGVHSKATEHEQVTVPSLPLDEVVELSDGDRVVAWVDVEGANEVVLRSGPSVLDRTEVMYIEVENRTTWEHQWLDTDVALHLRDHGLVPVARDIERPHQYNAVFVRAGLVEDPDTLSMATEVLR